MENHLETLALVKASGLKIVKLVSLSDIKAILIGILRCMYTSSEDSHRVLTFVDAGLLVLIEAPSLNGHKWRSCSSGYIWLLD